MGVDRGGMVGQSACMQQVFAVLAKVSPTDSTVLVTGEAGTGKRLLVKVLHANSRRKGKPLVLVNCGSAPMELHASELFGKDNELLSPGSITRPSQVEMADGGTLFLNEVHELDLTLQAKILHVIQEKKVERLGSGTSTKVDVRIIAATSKDLTQEVALGRFREDLYYRLNVIPLRLSPLRDRIDDIVPLSRHFLNIFCQEKQRTVLKLSQKAEELLRAYPWPGNIRELENYMERMSIFCENQEVQPEDLPESITQVAGKHLSRQPPAKPFAHSFAWPTLKDLLEHNQGLREFLDEVEVRLIQQALEKSQGVKNQAAELLGIKRTTLIEKLKKRGSSS
jgi:sigma-54 dependent transcriptional regulator, flagellar regulatory protein